MDPVSELLSQIVRMHFEAKSLILLAEQINLGQGFVVQPMKEQRDAHDHLMRARARELNLKDSKHGKSEGPERDREYIMDNYRKALGHECRAFFDAADVISMEITNEILRIVVPFKSTQITSVIPNFYTEIKPALRSLDQSIADVRGDKDVSKENPFDEVDSYKAIVKKLVAYSNEVAKAVPDLNKVKNEDDAAIERQQAQHQASLSVAHKSMVWAAITAIIAAAAFLGGCLYNGANNPESPAITTPSTP